MLANLPLWRILLPIFLDRMLSRVSSQGDAALADLHHVRRLFLSRDVKLAVGEAHPVTTVLLQVWQATVR